MTKLGNRSKMLFPLELAITSPERSWRIAAQRVRCGRLILASNVLDLSQLSASDALREYKAQQGVERGFGFLKDPLFFTKECFSQITKTDCRFGHDYGFVFAGLSPWSASASTGFSSI